MEFKIDNRKYIIYVKNDYFFIVKKNWITKKEIFRVKCSSIVDIKYDNPYKIFNPLFKFLYFLISLIGNPNMGGENVWKRYLIVTYLYDDEIITSNINVNIGDTDLIKLKRYIKSK